MISPKARRIGRGILGGMIVITLGIAVMISDYYNLIPKKSYTADKFGIQELSANMDYNGNGVDDYADFLTGARADAQNHPTYDGRYWAEGGYPPDDIGVCTDVVWRAFRQAGYSLRDMVDASIEANPEWYDKVEHRDKNIDFRRVGNLRIFFEHYGLNLTTDPDQIQEWQPGDIVVFEEDAHIGIISNQRNKKGWAYVIHNGGQPRREEDFLGHMQITGHYRFDASQISPDVLYPFQ